MTCYGAGVSALLLSVSAGTLFFLGFIGFGYWPLIFLFPVFLLASIEGRNFWVSVALGTLCGFVGMCGGYYWLVDLLMTFGDFSLPLALLGYVLLSAYQGLLWGCVAGLVCWSRQRLGISPAWSLPWAVILCTWTYPLLFHSFLAAAFYRVPILNQIADLGGAYGVDGLIALVAGGTYSLLPWSTRIRGFSWRPAVVSVLALSATLAYGGIQLSRWGIASTQARTLPVALIQSNLGEKDKTEKRKLFLHQHQQMSREAIRLKPETELIVWPEAAFNRAILRDTTNVGQFITTGITRSVLSGSITVEILPEGRKLYNSIILVSATGEVAGIYDKIRLLAFGESIPVVDDIPELGRFLRKNFLPRTSNFQRGNARRHLHLRDGTKLLPMICYEDLLPSQSRQIWLEDGPPDAMVNVTNDSWFGNGHEPRIHLALAALRSIETRRSLIRSTNTGVSAVILPTGRPLKQSGQWTQEIIFADVPLIEDGSTSVYIMFGDWLAWISLALFLGGLVWSRRALMAKTS
ncbi:MAG: apolipoprotein N-acyltransferase [Myxococcales bacterium]|nr:apolipoprotein N-acyltransferase [Myxococcales bacterium]